MTDFNTILYHGTKYKISKKTKIKAPLFLTVEKEDAAWFTDNGDDYSAIVSGVLSPHNILDMTENTELLYDIAERAGIQFTRGSPTEYFQCDEIANHSDYDGTNDTDLIYIPAVQEQLKKEGFETVKCWTMLENYEIISYIVLNTNHFNLLNVQSMKSYEKEKTITKSKVKF